MFLLTIARPGRAHHAEGRADLCAECAEVMRLLVCAAPWKADELLQVLDGEPPVAVRQEAAKQQEARGEVPFDGAGHTSPERAAERYHSALQQLGKYAPERLERMTAAYLAAAKKGWPEHMRRVAASSQLPQTTLVERVVRAMSIDDGAGPL